MRISGTTLATTLALGLLAAATPAAAESRRDSTGIRVTSDPDGAEVYVNGVLVGETPTRANVAPGRHEVLLVLDDVEHELIVRVRQGRMTRIYHDFREDDRDDRRDDRDDGRRRDDRDDERYDDRRRDDRRRDDRYDDRRRDDRDDDRYDDRRRDDRDDDRYDDRRRDEGDDDRYDDRRRDEGDDERYDDDGWGDEEEDGGEEPRRFGRRRGEDGDEEDDGSWASRINRWPMIDLQVINAPIERTFKVPIDDNIDLLGRNQIDFVSGWFGVIGFDFSVFPFARFDQQALRGLGLQARGAFGFLLDWEGVDDTLDPPDLSYYAIDIDLLYRLVLGRLDVGAEMELRVGYHREDFDIGDENNDLVAPFTYDTVRFDLGFRIPLRTRHMLGVIRGAYLLVPSIGEAATYAYSAEDTEVTSHGAEVHIGFLWRVGGLELSWTYIGRLYWNRFQGVGRGFGDDPTTDVEEGGSGIQLLETAKDGYQQVRFAIGYRW